jgi:hypothetical protein
MRAARSNRSPWLVGMLVLFVVIPVLYLLSVPPLKYAVHKPEWITLPFKDTGKTVSAWHYRGSNPDWLKAYAAPYEWLKVRPPLGRVLYMYHNWWWKTLGR